MPSKKYFTIDARTVLALGRESIKDHTTAVLELVKNAYDAGANIVEIELRQPGDEFETGMIRISDNGHGMNDDDVTKKWLRIGYSEKRVNSFYGKRRRIGEKGIGRLSADRLGSLLVLKSQSLKSQSIGLTIDWDEFDNPGTDLGKIEIRADSDVSFMIPAPSTFDKTTRLYNTAPDPVSNNKATSGTELRIQGLRQQWLAVGSGLQPIR